jgi:hypothetical protein
MLDADVSLLLRLLLGVLIQAAVILMVNFALTRRSPKDSLKS